MTDNSFNPDAEFEKWAAIEVMDFETIPDAMETLTLKGGLYAVFLYRALPLMHPKPSGIYLEHGCHVQTTYWTTDPILKY